MHVMVFAIIVIMCVRLCVRCWKCLNKIFIIFLADTPSFRSFHHNPVLSPFNLLYIRFGWEGARVCALYQFNNSKRRQSVHRAICCVGSNLVVISCELHTRIPQSQLSLALSSFHIFQSEKINKKVGQLCERREGGVSPLSEQQTKTRFARMCSELGRRWKLFKMKKRKHLKSMSKMIPFSVSCVDSV